jgi:hypothetical protein
MIPELDERRTPETMRGQVTKDELRLDPGRSSFVVLGRSSFVFRPITYSLR